MNRPLTITTTTHAMAIVLYAVQAFLGILYLTGVAQAMALEQLVGEGWAKVWAILLTASGAVATGAVLNASKQRDPDSALKMEWYAATILSIVSLLYEASLLITNGIGVPTTQAYALAVGVGAGARAIQISRDRRRLARARSNPHPADPPPLAEEKP